MFARHFLLLLISIQLLYFSASAQTNLFTAIRSGSSDEVNKTLTNGADANDSLTGYSALMYAALNGTVGQMSILISHGANVNFQNADSISALWLALPDMDKVT